MSCGLHYSRYTGQKSIWSGSLAKYRLTHLFNSIFILLEIFTEMVLHYHAL